MILGFIIGLLASIIIIPILLLIFRTCKAIMVYGIFRMFSISSNLNCYKEEWTVVTGCTDGIGKAYLNELLRKGLKKFILVSRNPQKLNKLCNEIRKDYINCDLETFAFDFTTSDDYQNLEAFLHKFEIHLLVNMVGVGPNRMEKYGVLPDQDTTILTVNIMAAAKMMQIVLPQMERRNKGTIVNMSSSQSFAPIPLLASYSASKIAIAYLSECVRYEYHHKSIKVQCLIPLLVATKMSKYNEAEAGHFVVSSEDFARQAVHSMHLLNHTTGCLSHEIQMAWLYLLPWPLLRPGAMRVYTKQRRRMNALAA